MYKLLIVDDEAIEREAIRFILSKSDLKFSAIEEATNGQEAISVAAVYKPDIILMDIKMPGLDGMESTRIIQKIKEDVKVIFLTAFDEFEYAREGIQLGAVEFVVKPATNERIIEVLKKAIELLDREKVQKENQAIIEDKLKQVSKYLENEFLVAVIQGDLTRNQLKEYTEFMNIDGEYGFGAAMILHYEEEANGSDLRKQMLKKRLIERLERLLTGQIRHYFITHIKDMLYLMVLEANEDQAFTSQDVLKEILVRLSIEAEEEFSIYTDYGIGDVKGGTAELWQSFATARANCHKKIYEQQDERSETIMHNLILCTLEGDESRLHECVASIFDYLTEKTHDMKKLKARLYEWIVIFNQNLIRECPLKLEAGDMIFSRITDLTELTEARTFLRDYLHKVMVDVASQKADKTMVIMDKLITYINNHYAENITLEKLGEMSGFSLFYLSKVFKKHVDMNFSDYLAFIRIKVAKRLLKNPQKSVKEISYEVGYTDPNYFARVFRKYEYMTPTEYRNKNMNL